VHCRDDELETHLNVSEKTLVIRVQDMTTLRQCSNGGVRWNRCRGMDRGGDCVMNMQYRDR
jgi:hypothetical protein